jgi:PAS domain S-box-containing protein
VTITSRILFRVAAAAAVTISISTAVTYWRVFGAAETQGVSHLADYVRERAHAEHQNLIDVEQNLELARALFLKRDGQPLPYDLETVWNRRNLLHADGAWRTRREGYDGRKMASLWMGKVAPATRELKARVLVAEDISNDFIMGWIDAFPSLYFIFPEQVNIGFDPRIPNFVWDASADYDTCAAAFYQDATPARNPGRRIIWGATTKEPVSQNPYVSVTAPLYKNNHFIGIVGHDIALDELLANTSRTGLPGAAHYIFRRDGRLIAHPGKEKEIVESDGTFALQTSGDPALAAMFAAANAHPEEHFSGYLAESDSYYAASRLSAPDWIFLTTMPREFLREPAVRSARTVLWAGLGALGIEVLLVGWIVRGTVARPINELLVATRRMAAGESAPRLAGQRNDELGKLAAAFNEMSENVRTERANLEGRVAERTRELATSKERFSKAFQLSPTAIGLTRLSDGTLVDVNDAFLKISGYTREEVIGRTPQSLQLYGDPSQRDEYLELLREHGAVRDREQVLRAKDGRKLTMLVAGGILDLDGQPHVMSVGLDISERKQAEQDTMKALEHERQLNEMKTSFVSMVSHEFRTPLGVIQSASDVLDRYLDRLTPDKRRKHLDMIFRSTKNLSQLVDGVLLLGKVEDGRMHFTPAPIDLSSVCHQFVDEIRSATSARADIECLVEPGVEGAESDVELLRHIFGNLLSNAVKYSDAGARVEFHVARAGADMIATVRDHGIGIAEADQANLFKSFARGQNVGQRPGTGLGLNIVQRCVALHGGSIEVESALGVGTTVTVRLPVFNQRRA